MTGSWAGRAVPPPTARVQAPPGSTASGRRAWRHRPATAEGSPRWSPPRHCGGTPTAGPRALTSVTPRPRTGWPGAPQRRRRPGSPERSTLFGDVGDGVDQRREPGGDGQGPEEVERARRAFVAAFRDRPRRHEQRRQHHGNVDERHPPPTEQLGEEAGTKAAAPTPCRTRAPTSAHGSTATPSERTLTSRQTAATC